jgi:hypothetical protein
MSEIKKHDEHVSHYAYVTYFKDEGMYKVKGSVHVNIEEGVDQLYHEVTEVNLEFFVNDKRCNYVGFKDLYQKLFNNSSWKEYESNLWDEFTTHYLENKVKL